MWASNIQVYESSESGIVVSQFCGTEKPKLFLLLRIALESPMMAEGEMIGRGFCHYSRGGEKRQNAARVKDWATMIAILPASISVTRAA